ncbi:MAG: hypothetical protein SVR81_11005, partial [Chloroflexota bacterium]|nr:hypothetical protein [Chloroflexota bacterium]
MMQNKGWRTCLSIGAGILAIVLVFAAGAAVGYFGPRYMGLGPNVSGPVSCPPCAEATLPNDGDSAATITECPECPYADPSGSTPADQEALFAPFWETWELLHENYVDQPLDDLALMRGAISGMLASLGDPHTSYMTPDEFQQANESLEGEYEGIGAWVDVT